jgi:hypothetical protein
MGDLHYIEARSKAVMRTILIGNKRIKVITHQKFLADDLWDECCFEFKEIGKSELSFSRPITRTALEKLDYVEIFFKISGKWRKYKISEFSLVIEEQGQTEFSKVIFNMSQDQRPEFEQSFRIARCC